MPRPGIVTTHLFLTSAPALRFLSFNNLRVCPTPHLYPPPPPLLGPCTLSCPVFSSVFWCVLIVIDHGNEKSARASTVRHRPRYQVYDNRQSHRLGGQSQGMYFKNQKRVLVKTKLFSAVVFDECLGVCLVEQIAVAAICRVTGCCCWVERSILYFYFY